MTRPILLAALAYFAAVFALGFVLGSLRVLWMVPRVGELAAVAIELPAILAASWFFARRFTRLPVFARAGARLAMGLVAFAFLIAAEFALGTLGFGQSASAWLAALARPAGALGLAGQVLFALMPLVAR